MPSAPQGRIRCNGDYPSHSYENGRKSAKADRNANDGFSDFIALPVRIVAVDANTRHALTEVQALETMKMKHSLVASFDGVAADPHARKGAQLCAPRRVRIERRV